MSYFKLLYRCTPRQTDGKYFIALYPEEILQRRQYTITRLDWIIIRSINIKKKYFNPLVPKFCSRFLPLKSSNTCIFSIFGKKLKLLKRVFSILHLSRNFTHINVVLPTGYTAKSKFSPAFHKDCSSTRATCQAYLTLIYLITFIRCKVQNTKLLMTLFYSSS